MAFEVKKMVPGTWDYYKLNIQEQFVEDENFAALCEYFVRVDINSQTFLSDIINGLNLAEIENILSTVTEENQYQILYMLDMIASFCGIPSYQTFLENNDFNGNKIKSEFFIFYISLIKAYIKKSSWDGSNHGMQEIIETLFDPELDYYIWFIDQGNMIIDVFFEVNNLTEFETTKLYKYVNMGYFIPKPLGVQLTITVREKDAIFTWTNANGVWDATSGVGGWLSSNWTSTDPSVS